MDPVNGCERCWMGRAASRRDGTAPVFLGTLAYALGDGTPIPV